MLITALALAALGVAGCGSDEDREAVTDVTITGVDTAGAQETLEDVLETAEAELDEALTRDLEEQNSSGISGTAKLEPIAQDQIKVTIELDGADDGASYPAHVHSGTCANLDPNPEYPLTNVQGSRSETTIDASPLDVFTGEFAVNVHDPDDPSKYVACADIPSPTG